MSDKDYLYNKYLKDIKRFEISENEYNTLLCNEWLLLNDKESLILKDFKKSFNGASTYCKYNKIVQIIIVKIPDDYYVSIIDFMTLGSEFYYKLDQLKELKYYTDISIDILNKTEKSEHI